MGVVFLVLLLLLIVGTVVAQGLEQRRMPSREELRANARRLLEGQRTQGDKGRQLLEERRRRLTG